MRETSSPNFTQLDSTVSFYSMNNNSNITLQNVFEFVNSKFKLDYNHTFKRFRTDRITDKITIEKFELFYNNVPIEPAKEIDLTSDSTTPLS